MSESKKPFLCVADRPEEMTFSHPLNPNSEMCGLSLSEAVGLRRVGVNLVRIPPGKEANIYHSHVCEEEFFFILEGRGIVEVDGEEHEIGPGDFLGFPTPAVPHQLRNPFQEELVYLAGGERKEAEIAEFPKLGKHVIRVGRSAHVVDSDKLEPFWKGEA
jgi:uncharacterized cupin superfamily protein